MKTSEFKAAIEKQEKIIQNARAERKRIYDVAIAELCPFKKGDEIRAFSDHPGRRKMIIKHIHIVPPVFHDCWEFNCWEFRLEGDIVGSGDEGKTVIPFPED